MLYPDPVKVSFVSEGDAIGSGDLWMSGSEMSIAEYINQMLACAKGIADGYLKVTNYRRRPTSYAGVGRANIMFDASNVAAKVSKLSSLTLRGPNGAIALAGGFSPDTTSYTVTVKDEVAKISIRPTTPVQAKKVSIAADSGSAQALKFRSAYDAELKVGSNVFTIEVSQDEAKTVYSLTVVHE
jgi:hypothetical protein